MDVSEGAHDLTPEAYAAQCMAWIEAGATIVGGCCEVGPAHIVIWRKRLVDANGYEIVGGH